MLEVLPLALAIAASPFPVIPAILLLFSAQPLRNGSSFLAGWMIGVGTITGLAILLADLIDQTSDAPRWVALARIVLGAALVAVGLRQWFTRASKTEMPSWMASIESATPASAIRLGLFLSAANPKIILLAAAGGIAIANVGSTASAQLTGLMGFTLIGSMTVAAPVLAYALLGDRVLSPLEVAKNWLTRNNAAIMAVVIVVIGGSVLSTGLQAL